VNLFQLESGDMINLDLLTRIELPDGAPGTFSGYFTVYLSDNTSFKVGFGGTPGTPFSDPGAVAGGVTVPSQYLVYLTRMLNNLLAALGRPLCPLATGLSISSISPSSITIANGDVEVTVTGSGFTPGWPIYVAIIKGGTLVLCNKYKYISPTQFSFIATMTSSLAAGLADVVLNPFPSGFTASAFALPKLASGLTLA
jgi:hypothetical protein